MLADGLIGLCLGQRAQCSEQKNKELESEIMKLRLAYVQVTKIWITQEGASAKSSSSPSIWLDARCGMANGIHFPTSRCVLGILSNGKKCSALKNTDFEDAPIETKAYPNSNKRQNGSRLFIAEIRILITWRKRVDNVSFLLKKNAVGVPWSPAVGT